MIPTTKNAFAFSDVETEDMLKLIWGVSVAINLSFIFISGLNIYFQCFYFFSVLILGVILIFQGQTKNTFSRLILGVLILDIWFIQSITYRGVDDLSFLITFTFVSLELAACAALLWTGSVLAFASEVILALLPLNLAHNLSQDFLTLYVLFFVIFWYLKEAYYILKHKKCQENLLSRIGIIIPLFNLHFVPMCVYYLLISSWEGYALYSKETTSGNVPDPEVGKENPPTPEEVEKEKLPEIKKEPPLPPPPLLPLQKPAQPKLPSVPRFRPLNTQPPRLPTPEPLNSTPLLPPQKENKNLGENLKKLYS